MLFKRFKLLTVQCLPCPNKGFTLAEVMVVLGILGILAAFLVPAIMQTAPNNNMVMFKKGYSILEEAISTMSNDDTNYPSDQQGTTTDTPSATVPRVFNFTDAKANGTTNKFCYFLTDKLNTVGSMTAACPAVDADASINGYFTTTDGIIWTIKYVGNDGAPNIQFPLSSSSYDLKIIMDVNGTSKGPNCSTDSAAASYTFGSDTGTALTQCSFSATCNDVADRFIIGVRYDGKLQIGSGATTDTCAINILSNPTRNIK